MRRLFVVGLVLLLGGAAYYLWLSIATERLQSIAARSESPDIDLHSNRVRTVVERADHILFEIQQTCAESHLRFVGSTRFVPTWAQFSPDFLSHIGQTLTSVEAVSDDHHFTFSYENGRLRDYQNRALDNLPEANLLFDPPDQPKWTREQAIQVAAKFLSIFADPKDARFGLPIANYDHTGAVLSKTKSGLKTYLGSWYVLWPRVDSHGHLFSGDGVKIVFHEGFGPSGAGINLSTSYQEENGDPIPLSNAIADAHDALSRKRHWYSFFWKTHDDSPVRSSCLQIVLPFKDPDNIFGPTADVARLAWIIWFRPNYSSYPSSRGWVDPDFAVWIDAYTGKVIGRDVMN